MGPMLVLLRTSIRHGWKGLLAIALLIGVAGGAILTGAEAARRTNSAFDRMRTATDAWDVLVNPDDGIDSRIDPALIGELPEVAAIARMDGILLGQAHLGAITELEDGPLTLASDGVAGYDFARYQLLDGRMPDEDAADEVLLSREASEQLGLGVGDVWRAKVLTFADFESVAGITDVDEVVDAFNRPDYGTMVDLEVVGVGVGIDELVVDESFVNGAAVVPPAFWEAYDQPSAGFFGLPVRLADGASPDDLRRAVEALAPDESFAFQTADAVEEQVDRAVRPEVSAIRIFTLIAAVVMVVIVGQAMSRRLQLDAVSDPPLRALGLTRVQRAVLGVARMGLTGVVGAAIAVTIAVLASPVAPIGLVRDAEPDPGIRVDAVVVIGGFVAVVLVSTAIAVWPAVRTTRARTRERTRAGVVSSALVRWGLRPATVMGARFALEPGPTAVPTRSTLIGAATSVVLVAATVTFAAGLDHFVDTPDLYGTTWSHVLSVDTPSDLVDPDPGPVADQLAADERVEAFSMVVPGQVTLDGVSVPALALANADSPRPLEPSVIEGRVPAADDEVALGTGTLDDLGVEIGDQVTVTGTDGEEGSLEVVGRAVLPVVAAYPGSDKTTLGEGAALTIDGLRSWSPEFSPEGFATRFVDGVEAEEVAADLDLAPSQFIDVDAVGRPSDVASLDRVRSTPVLLTALLATLIALTVTHALGAAVRARRRELAVLRTFGFSRAQVLGAVATQATLIAAVGLVIGIPVGIAAGRLAWSRVAEDLGAFVSLVTPTLALTVVAVAVVGVANLVGLVPGLRAAAAHPADTLRTE
jgi:hypothetical protein